MENICGSITVQQLKQKIDNGENIVILDVRNEWELAKCSIKDSLNIPLNCLADNLEKIQKNNPIAVLCHHGIRSRQATYFLLENGFKNVKNITGGIEAWAQYIDLTMERY